MADDAAVGPPRLVVGLTGGIRSGKSVVARRLAELGAVVIDGDRLAREVVAPGTDGLAEVVAAFGPEVLAPDGSMDRAKVGQLVFGDDALRRKLESIIHPRVRERSITRSLKSSRLRQPAQPASTAVVTPLLSVKPSG